ncbi:MAG: hypothetical protein RIG62_27875 [Cyclobacteriaceae bacterium]
MKEVAQDGKLRKLGEIHWSDNINFGELSGFFHAVKKGLKFNGNITKYDVVIGMEWIRT